VRLDPRGSFAGVVVFLNRRSDPTSRILSRVFAQSGANRAASDYAALRIMGKAPVRLRKEKE